MSISVRKANSGSLFAIRHGALITGRSRCFLRNRCVSIDIVHMPLGVGRKCHIRTFENVVDLLAQ